MFGLDLLDVSLLPALFIALVAGMLSFLSPCVLPIVPPYLAYMGGVSMGHLQQDRQAKRAALIAACFFVLGLSTVFILLGAAASALGQTFLQNQILFNRIAGGVIILFGVHFTGLLRLTILYREARIDVGNRGGRVFGAYLLGLAFAFGWTPCIGPILGAILSLAVQNDTAGQAMILMAFYALGLGVPFILAALFINRAIKVMNRFKRHMRKVEIAMGLLLIVIGITMITGSFASFSFWLLEAFPFLGTIG